MSKGIQFSESQLWEVLNKHKDNISSVAKWDKYAKERDLPRAQTLIKRLGTWNEIKRQLDISTNKQSRPLKYTKEEILEVLADHKEFFENQFQWNQYAKEKGLPSYKVMENYLGEEVLGRVLGVGTSGSTERISTKAFSKKRIADQIKGYFPITPPTIEQWKEVNQINSELANYQTIIKQFGSWNKMKDIYIKPLDD